MSKVEQIDQLIMEQLALAINKELQLPGVLVTVTYVKTAKDLQFATVGVSVLPDKLAGTVMARLKKLTGLFSSILSKKTRLRKIPKLSFVFDMTEKKAAILEDYLAHLDQIEAEE